MVHAFPNLFLPSSDLSPSGLSNMTTLAEQQVDVIFDTIEWLDQHGSPLLHPLRQSQEQWREETLRYAPRRPGALNTKSWYFDGNIPGKPQVLMLYCGGFKRYNETCYGKLENGFLGYALLESPGARGDERAAGG